MSTPLTTGRRRVATRLYAAENQALDQIAKEAEARLAARRQARAEAREIRMRELEKQQREADEQSDRHYELLNDPVRNNKPPREGRPLANSTGGGGSSYSGSRHSSEDLTDLADNKDLRLNDLEEKFRRAMVNNAQLDNEKSTLVYQVDLGKDKIEELEEEMHYVSRQLKEKSRAHDQLNREIQRLKEENSFLQESIKQRDELIEEHGLVLVGGEPLEEDEEGLANGEVPSPERRKTCHGKAALVTPEAAHLLEQAGEGSLDVRLKKFAEEKQDLLDEIYRLRLDLEEERQRNSSRMEQWGLNGPDRGLDSRETSKQVADYKFRLKKAEQENATLQATITRLESQVSRYKAAADNAETVEDELKAEKRKLLREFREAQARIEELETANAHLQKRIDKLKSTRNALMKT